MIPQHVHQIWFGKPPTEKPLHWAMIESVRRHNPAFSFRVWDESDLPEFGEEIEALKDRLGTWAAISNLVRLLVLRKFGGVYLDTDFECLGPIDVLLAGSAVAAMQDEERICNAFMAAEPDHPWINWQIAHFNDFDPRDAASGVYLATAAPRGLVTLVQTRLVYPWKYDDPPEKRVPAPDSILAHAWAGSWSKKP